MSVLVFLICSTISFSTTFDYFISAFPLAKLFSSLIMPPPLNMFLNFMSVLLDPSCSTVPCLFYLYKLVYGFMSTAFSLVFLICTSLFLRVLFPSSKPSCVIYRFSCTVMQISLLSHLKKLLLRKFYGEKYLFIYFLNYSTNYLTIYTW
jgi:hypothetical protein